MPAGSTIIAVDLVQIQPIKGVKCLQGDITTDEKVNALQVTEEHTPLPPACLRKVLDVQGFVVHTIQTEDAEFCSTTKFHERTSKSDNRWGGNERRNRPSLSATDEPRLPVSEVRLRKLAACVRQNRAEKLNVTEQDVLDVVAKRRSDFVAQLLATLELEETERQQFTQARARELAAASALETQERTKLQRNAQRQLLRADRLRRIASLTVSEVAHRRRLLEAWHMVWPPVAEKLECRTRTALLKAESDDRTALLALSAEEYHEARKAAA
ncbi:hypothetical protein DIPPA_19412 [Diplonema papillatum]|nr:hypothetical protein DIPPA_19412 [Diplonema papillatum]